MPEIYTDSNPLIPLLQLGFMQAGYFLASFALGVFLALGVLTGTAWFVLRAKVLFKKVLDKPEKP